MKTIHELKVIALAGGVGGAKMADGLNQVLSPGNLTVVVNTGDDFDHLGLRICPDIDTICYTLARLNNDSTGWGRAGETWNALETISSLGGDPWFKIGDMDLGLHLERTRLLTEGWPLSKITARFCNALNVPATVLPMTDDPVSTIIVTEQGKLSFQEYFVRQQCTPEMKGFEFKGIESARPADSVIDAIRQADLVVLCPSNPWVSLDPILGVAGIKNEVRKKKVAGVSPLIAGRSVKGPAAKMFLEMGIQPGALAVAEHYKDLLDFFVIDRSDASIAGEIQHCGIIPMAANIMIPDRAARKNLAREMLEFIFEYQE